ncbi:hypothetical protein CF326_g3540 [Tilletia indica]|nr:hypothetical protein CF326_g3540 [Tilletia indica]
MDTITLTGAQLAFLLHHASSTPLPAQTALADPAASVGLDPPAATSQTQSELVRLLTAILAGQTAAATSNSARAPTHIDLTSKLGFPSLPAAVPQSPQPQQTSTSSTRNDGRQVAVGQHRQDRLLQGHPYGRPHPQRTPAASLPSIIAALQTANASAPPVQAAARNWAPGTQQQPMTHNNLPFDPTSTLPALVERPSTPPQHNNFDFDSNSLNTSSTTSAINNFTSTSFAPTSMTSGANVPALGSPMGPNTIPTHLLHSNFGPNNLSNPLFSNFAPNTTSGFTLHSNFASNGASPAQLFPGLSYPLMAAHPMTMQGLPSQSCLFPGAVAPSVPSGLDFPNGKSNQYRHVVTSIALTEA